ncbi:hypothetical protein EDD22DRAFT_1047431 [Suillus occidentalis]|nr:hypothetical protein EDD22DRAFT_1047431 [Suillus occidentalis]
MVHTEPCNLLDFPATSPLPRSHISQPPAPPTSQSSAINTSSTLTSRLYRLWPLQKFHASPTVVDVPLAPGKLRNAAAGALGDDDDLIRDEDYVPPPSPSPNSRPGIVNAGQHGSGRFVILCSVTLHYEHLIGAGWIESFSDEIVQLNVRIYNHVNVQHAYDLTRLIVGSTYIVASPAVAAVSIRTLLPEVFWTCGNATKIK